MAKSENLTVEEKLRALFRLQLIDSKIDKIEWIKGELPLEVQDIEDELEGLRTRKERHEKEIADLDTEINGKRTGIKDAEELIKKYEGQKDNVRNNREFESITKEIEMQTLEIQLAEKRIREFGEQKVEKEEKIKETAEILSSREKDLKVKKKELQEIIVDTEKEEVKLQKASDKAAKEIEDRLLVAYKRIRTKVVNGLAVVPIERNSAAGSFMKIPPQIQIEIAARKKIILDEHSGRILVDSALAGEEEEKINKQFPASNFSL